MVMARLRELVVKPVDPTLFCACCFDATNLTSPVYVVISNSYYHTCLCLTPLAVVEGRGLARGEIGIASIDLKRPVLQLSQVYLDSIQKVVGYFFFCSFICSGLSQMYYHYWLGCLGVVG
jgi:hypothetical protein